MKQEENERNLLHRCILDINKISSQKQNFLNKLSNTLQNQMIKQNYKNKKIKRSFEYERHKFQFKRNTIDYIERLLKMDERELQQERNKVRQKKFKLTNDEYVS